MDRLERAIVYVAGDDWDGVYVEGLLKTEGHSVPAEDLLKIGSENGGLDVILKSVDFDWLGERGSFPQQLRDVRFEN